MLLVRHHSGLLLIAGQPSLYCHIRYFVIRCDDFPDMACTLFTDVLDFITQTSPERRWKMIVQN